MTVDLPVMPPISPMLAKAAPAIPADMQYEAKWDGFRAVFFVDGGEVVIGSRNEKPLTRYFPELAAAAASSLPDRCVIDGEIIIVSDDHLDFDALQNRIHPADSRVQLLAEQTPALFVGFDLLALADQDTMALPQQERRRLLEDALADVTAPFHLAPATTDQGVAKTWFSQFEGAGLDGVMAKPLDAVYQPGKRALVKVKHRRTADCVVYGFRWHKSGPIVGSLMLGLYDSGDELIPVGVTSSFTMVKRADLVDVLAPFRTGDGDVAGTFGPPSRWNSGKDMAFEQLRPELVVEVAYDHMQGNRFRHTTQFQRWRPDRDPRSCRFDQLEEPVSYSLSDVLS